MKKYWFVFLCFYSLINCFAQGPGPVITTLQSNAQLKHYRAPSSGLKRAAGDTLALPFIDDFTGDALYPDPKRWLDKQVYVNRHFAISPPTYGVATFDNLDPKGKPYRPLSGNTQGPSDTMTVKPINLKYFISGVTPVNYQLSDSIYFSFFYQPQGLGDVSDNTDSLVLKFKDVSGNWKTVWKKSGSKTHAFKQVLIPIRSTAYLFNGFQFRFINYTRNTGNMNQWHLDYIRLNSLRSYTDTAMEEVGINKIPPGPLKWYNTMPYDHFKANASFNLLSENVITAFNSNDTAVNINFAYQVRNDSNAVIYNIPSTSSGRNIQSGAETSDTSLQANLSSLNGKQPGVTLRYTLVPGSKDQIQNDYKGDNANNVLTRNFRFKNYFAYDDGSAEGGYGLDYAALPNGPGYAAIKFSTFKPDTLRGISIFFNRSVSDVSSKSFELMVWKSISEPPANNMDNDVLLKKIEVQMPIYSDSMNGFTDFIFDTAVVLPQGNFYIGWKQNINFILNIGYDNNYQYAQQKDYRNPNLFFSLLGYWEKVSASITGAVMMRPIVGEAIKTPPSASVKEVQKNTKISIYPNPSLGATSVMLTAPQKITGIAVYDMAGRMVLQTSENIENGIDISMLNSGCYTFVVTGADKTVYTQKYIKTE